MYSDRNKQEIVKKNIQKIRNTVNDNYKNKRSKYNKWVSEHQFTKAMAYLYANLLYDVTKSELPPNGSNLIKIFKKATLRVHPNKGGSHELFISASNAVNKLKLWHKYNNKKNNKRKEEEENRKRKEKGEVQILDKNYSIRDTRKLILFNRGLEIIPKDVFKLTNLEYLHLEVNHLLTSIPEEIGNLKNLKYLNLSRNSRITSIPDTIGNLKNLEELYLDFNNLTSIPDTIGNLENLEFLNLGHNNITSIPDTIGNLTNLLNLHLEYNNLRTIPDVFKNLTQLRELNFMSTKVVTPPSVFDLANLKIIYFSHYIFTPNLISKMISSKFKENIKIYHKHYEPKSKMKSYNKSQFILFLKSKQNEKFTNRLMSALKLKYSKLHKK